MAYTLEQIERIAVNWRDRPPIERKPRQVNKQEVVKLLAKEIQSRRQRGYTLKQIADALRGENFDTPTAVLKHCWQRAKRTKKKAALAAREALPPVTTLVVSPQDTTAIPRPDTGD